MKDRRIFLIRLFLYIRNYYLKLAFAIGSSITNKILDLMPPILVGWVVDSLKGDTPTWITLILGDREPLYFAGFLAVLAVVIFGFESLFQWMYQWSFLTLAQDVQNDLRVDTYKKLQQRETAFFDTHRLGDTISMLNNDVNQLERFLNNGLNSFLQLTVLFLFCGIVLFTTSWQLAIIGLLPLPVIVWGSIIYQRMISPRYIKVRESVGLLNSRLENNISGIQVIKSFTAEDFELDRVKDASTDYKRCNYNAIKYTSLYVPVIRIAIAVGFGGVLLLGSYWVLNDSAIITLGELVLFSMMIQRFLWTLTGLGRRFDEYQRAKASGNRIFGLLDAESKMMQPAEPYFSIKKKPSLKGEIEFENVSFHYRVELPILKNLSFKIPRGKTVGFAGNTGAGKTTIVKLILRLYDVVSGRILLDGIDIKKLTFKELRSRISLVSQDIYLFHGSIFENILYGNPSAKREDVIKVAELAKLNHFIDTLPERYETLVGERGIKLSGGQRQRLSIARAILKKAPVIILDEATSSVDTETEKEIQTNLDNYTKGRTAIIIAHRLSTIRQADIIHVIGDGKIAETGTHDELISRTGKYSELWGIQTGNLAKIRR
jgi:ATP-binding cassette subfamily B protein